MAVVSVPDLGEGIKEITVSSWCHKEGDAVKKDDDVVELSADKAIFTVSADTDGVLKTIVVPEGGSAAIGETLAHIE